MPAAMPGSSPSTAGASPGESLEGAIDRIVFQNPENGWTVARFQLDGSSRVVTLVGELPGVLAGTMLRVSGRFAEDPRYGTQFQVATFTPLDPGTLDGIERYLGSGLVKGIGARLARRIVETFGAGTLAVLDEEPGRIARVPGVGKRRAKRLAQAWSEQRRTRQAMIFLQGHGLSPAFATRVLQQYGVAAPALVRENPYRLALDVPGIGFRTADRIARGLGVGADAPERAAAGALQALSELSAQGHVAYPRDRFAREAGARFEIEPAAMEDAVGRLAARGDLVLEHDPELGPCVYPPKLFEAECAAARRVRELLARPVAPLLADPGIAFAAVEEAGLVRLAPLQKEALAAALGEKLLIVTGGPGVGKTTIVRGLLAVLEGHGREALLAAPTGRAAKRLAGATGRPAQTIHRLLEYSPKGDAFQRNAKEPLAADYVVIDETSMVDVVLFGHLLEAVPDEAQLLLVGDADQLPSVGPGAVLRDLLASGVVPAVRLTEVFRQAAESLIVQNAHRINEGQMPRLDDPDAAADFFFVEREEPAAAAQAVCELVRERIPRRFGFDPATDVQVLAPMHRGDVGTVALNAALQQALNPDGARLEGITERFRCGDKVMQLRNDYQREVFNGDIGRVLSADPEERTLAVDFDGRVVTYAAGDVEDLQLAYACSVHKAQGSEYPAVVLPLCTQHFPMLQRNLLYTAVTRGRKLVVVVGSRRALALAVQNGQTRERFTGLARRLRTDLD